MEEFGKYTLLQKLGQGGMAEVFLASEPISKNLTRFVVVKRILPHISEDQNFITLFLDEARLVSQLNHPNIAIVYDFGEIDGEYYIAMEYINGPTLSKFIKSARKFGGVPLSHALYIIEQVLNGLYYAHTKKDPYGNPLNIIHRDISPQNILISREGAVKLVDFGVAKSNIQQHYTVAGTFKGKYSYLAPEVCLKKPWDQRVDLWAIGVVLYEILYGRPLFKKSNELATLQAIINQPIPPITELRPEVPKVVEEFLKKALERDPDKRFQSAEEMLLKLEEVIDETRVRSSTIRLKKYLERLINESEELRAYMEIHDSIEKRSLFMNLIPDTVESFSESQPTAPDGFIKLKEEYEDKKKDTVKMKAPIGIDEFYEDNREETVEEERKFVSDRYNYEDELELKKTLKYGSPIVENKLYIKRKKIAIIAMLILLVIIFSLIIYLFLNP